MDIVVFQSLLSHELLTKPFHSDQLDMAVDRWVDRLVSLPELAVDMAKAHFRGYSRAGWLGDLSETDGDLSAIVQGTEDFKQGFSGF